MDGQIPTSGAAAGEPAVASLPASPALPVSQSGEWLRRLGAELHRSFRAHALFIGLVLSHAAAGVVVPPLLGVQPESGSAFFNAGFARYNLGVLGALTISHVIWVLAVLRPPQPARYLHKQLTSQFVTAERLAAVLPVLLLFPLFISTFGVFKGLITAIQPFAWDARFAEWDRVLHGGYQPWEWLQPLLGHSYATDVIDTAYLLWFYVCASVLFWQIVSLRRPRLRMQFLVAQALLWIVLGNLAATAFASAGPCYYGRVTGLPDPFAPLLDYLRGTSEMATTKAVAIQQKLWQSYAEHGAGVRYGISAMPSMHVAVAFLNTLLGFGVSRRLGLALGVFTIVTLIGSVHLGWHYAIDGYAGMLGAYVIWRAVGWFLARPAVTRLLWAEQDLQRDS